MVSRTALIIKYYNKKAVAEIETLSPLTYHSKKMKYLITYCNKDSIKELTEKIKLVKGVKAVEETLVDMAAYDFEE